MIQRIAKTLPISSMLIGLLCAGPSVCLGWSLNPFASNDKPQTTMVSRTTQKPPSAWDKVTTGTKNFFNKTGETLGLKKKQPRRPPDVVAARPPQVVPKAKPDRGLFGLFPPKEEKRPTVPDWIGTTKPVIP
jgi:hypothetical protein